MTEPSAPHPEYGPCDSLGRDGACSECTGIVARSTPAPAAPEPTSPFERHPAVLQAEITRLSRELEEARAVAFRQAADLARKVGLNYTNGWAGEAHTAASNVTFHIEKAILALNSPSETSHEAQPNER